MASISATTADVCICCGTAGQLECRTRAGTATLCGYSEFTSASTPPKKYRTKTYSGSVARAGYVGPGCGAGACKFDETADFSGTKVYSVTTCGITDTSNEHFQSSGCDLPCGTYHTPVDIPGVNDSWSAKFGANLTVTNSQTTSVCSTNGFCFDPGQCAMTLYASYTSANATMALSDEDTDADAIDRFQAGTSFGAWLIVGTDCSVPACCLARYEERVSGFSFAYGDAQYRVTGTGLLPSTNYDLHLQIWRRPFGVGSYTLYQTLVIPVTTDGSGGFVETGDVPNDIGYDTYCAAPVVFL